MRIITEKSFPYLEIFCEKIGNKTLLEYYFDQKNQKVEEIKFKESILPNIFHQKNIQSMILIY